MSPKLFYTTYLEFAQASEATTKVPALFTLAQAALESAWAAHAPGNNFFGIKAPIGTPPDQVQSFLTHEVVRGQTIELQQNFMKYPTPAESFIDHGNFFIRNHRYAGAFATTDPSEFAIAISKAGYATDPLYSSKLIAIIKLMAA
jgi:flagellar protein FlgJ